MGMFDYVRFEGLPMPQHCGVNVAEGQTKSLDNRLGTIVIRDGLLRANPGYNGYLQPSGKLPWTGVVDYHAGCPKCDEYLEWRLQFIQGDLVKIEDPFVWSMTGWKKHV